MAPRNHYDLLDEQAIPVRWASSVRDSERPSAVGFRELLLRAHEITSLAVPLPPALSALYRILYALTTRITGLDRAEGWSEKRLRVLRGGRLDPNWIETYFDRYSDRFRLYDPAFPFLQDPRLAEQCDKPAGVNKLVVTRPSGNNHSWFGHVSDARPDPLSSSEALQHLLVWRYYGPSGRCSARAVDGHRAAQASAGPLRGALSYHPEGATLFTSLLAGVTVPGIGVDPEEDLCPWEWTEQPSPVHPPKATAGPCSRLTTTSQHALLLVPDENGSNVRDAFITWAFRDKMPREDDYLIWHISKEGNPYPRSADSGRALWRDLDALLLEQPEGAAQPRRPAVFRSALELADVLDESAEGLKVRALGFEQDGQAKDIQLVAASTPELIGLLTNTDIPVARVIGPLRVVGEQTGIRLGTATRNAWKSYTNAKKTTDCPWSQEAAARYWPAAEQEFWRRLRDRDFQGAASSFRRIAESIYDQVTYNAAGTARGARAREEARIDLYGGKRKATSASLKRKQTAPGAGTRSRHD